MVWSRLPFGAVVMAYDLRLLAERVEAYLSASPRKLLRDVAAELGVDRHTVERAVRDRTGKTFRQLQREALAAEALKLLTSEPPRSVKEVCFLLGYRSSSGFSTSPACLREPPTGIRKAGAQLPGMSAGGNLLGLVRQATPSGASPPPRKPARNAKKCSNLHILFP